MMLIGRRELLGTLGGASFALGQSRPALAIRNARIVTVAGPVMAKGTVLVEDGMISGVGENVNIPAGSQVIEAEGMTIYPGLIDSLSNLGLSDSSSSAGTGAARFGPPAAAPSGAAPSVSRGPEDRPLTTPWIRAADLVRANDRRIPIARSSGFTTAVVFPSSGIIAGQGSVINLAGDRTGQMVVEPSVGIYTTLATNRGGGFPAALMGTIAYIRQLYIDAEHYRLAKQMYQQNPSLPRPNYDRALDGLLEARLTLFPAVQAHEIDRIIRLSKELKTKAGFYGLHEGFRRINELKATGAPLLINLRWPEAPRDQDPEDQEDLKTLELRDQAPATPGLLAKAGARFAFASGGIERPSDILRAVKKAIDAGLPHAEAVRAMTLSPAEFFGVSNRLGSVEKGKIANLTVTKGDLFAEGSKVQFVTIDGVKYEPLPEEAPAGRPELSR